VLHGESLTSVTVDPVFKDPFRDEQREPQQVLDRHVRTRCSNSCSLIIINGSNKPILPRLLGPGKRQRAQAAALLAPMALVRARVGYRILHHGISVARVHRRTSHHTPRFPSLSIILHSTSPQTCGDRNYCCSGSMANGLANLNHAIPSTQSWSFILPTRLTALAMPRCGDVAGFHCVLIFHLIVAIHCHGADLVKSLPGPLPINASIFSLFQSSPLSIFHLSSLIFVGHCKV
jgi:hypothetical protein